MEIKNLATLRKLPLGSVFICYLPNSAGEYEKNERERKLVSKGTNSLTFDIGYGTKEKDLRIVRWKTSADIAFEKNSFTIHRCKYVLKPTINPEILQKLEKEAHAEFKNGAIENNYNKCEDVYKMLELLKYCDISIDTINDIVSDIKSELLDALTIEYDDAVQINAINITFDMFLESNKGSKADEVAYMRYLNLVCLNFARFSGYYNALKHLAGVVRKRVPYEKVKKYLESSE